MQVTDQQAQMAPTFPDAPRYLQGATRFQSDAATIHGLWVIETLKRYDEAKGKRESLLAPVNDAVATYATSRYGRRRMRGHWQLAYLAFVFSRQADVRPWWQNAGHSIWRAAGFRERPSYPATQMRFAELEHPKIVEAFEMVAATLIRLAVKGSDGQVGRYLHVDATEAETHARLEHICPAGSPCWNGRRRRRNGRPGAAVTADGDDPTDGNSTGPRRDAHAERGTRVTAAESINTVRSERHAKSEEPEPEPDLGPDTEIGDADRLVRKNDRLLVQVGGCWYTVLDPTAGVRVYVRGNRVRRFWVGFYNAKAIDHFTGAPVAVRITSASTQEHLTYPALYEAAVTNTGAEPRAVAADRGYSVSSVFEHNTRRGVGSVIPWRAWNQTATREAEDCDTHDRHGIVRCKHCGSPTDFVSFAKTAGKGRGPRLYVQCSAPVTAACEKRQSISCATNWRMLLPLWRDSPVYLALRHSHDRYERAHHHWRVRWRSGADDHALRPKRRGRDCQQLRANAALLVEWLIICWREKWLPDSRPRGRPDTKRIVIDDGSAAVASLATLRQDLGLDLPYGTQAAKLSLGGLDPTPGSRMSVMADPSEPLELPGMGPLNHEPLTDDELQPGRNAAEVDLDDLPF